MEKLTLNDLAATMGATPEELKPHYNAAHDFSFTNLEGKERDNVLLSVIKKADSQELTVSGPEKKAQWEKGWNENLEKLRASDGDLSALVPKYIRPGAILRLNGGYIRPSDDRFELNYFSMLRDYLCARYLKNSDSIYEFGCGPGLNLVAMAQQYPQKDLHGLDWVSAPKQILEFLQKRYHFRVQGHIFDMFSPDKSVALGPKSGVLSIGSLEQLGMNFKAFLSYLLEQKPGIVVNVNHFTELYDPDVLLDYLAIKFERRRNYLYGFIPELQRLEKEKKIEIIKLHRAHFGSLFHDGYSYVVWRPL